MSLLVYFQAILTGAGVGNAEASALATTLAWVIKDGVGMLGSLLFAYLCSDLFEINVKEWRLVADILCNVALTIDMLVSFLPNWFLELTSISSICKACCGLVAGATRARISAHFAHKGHLADVTAKESTQETAVTLLGLGLGLVITKVVADNKVIAWSMFFSLMILHQYANYELVRVLVLDTLNPQRIYLIVDNVQKNQLKDRSSSSLLPTPQDLVVIESIYRPIWLAFYGPQLGCSVAAVLNTLQNVSVVTAEPISVLWHRLLSAWGNEKFVIAIDMSCRPLILLEENSNEADYVKAYSIACYFMHSWTKLNKSVFECSSNITKCLQSITTSGASNGLFWYEKNVLRPGLGKYGWEVGEGKARLGEGTWRFCRSSPLSISSGKKEY
jgi:hypothetical protein